jgi:hypothetical protein
VSDPILYPKHNPADLEPHYARHVAHMPHAKADIAELARLKEEHRGELLDARRNAWADGLSVGKRRTRFELGESEPT